MRLRIPCRSRAMLGALIGAVVAAGVLVAAQTGVTLTSTTSPAAAQPGIQTITVTGSGFPAGTIPPANVTVAFQPANGGPLATATATTIATVVGTTRRVTFTIPAAVSVTTPTAYRVGISGRTTTGISFASTNTAALTVNPPPRIASVTPSTAVDGATVAVAITTEFTNFVQGSTQASFGSGVSVGGAAAGAFGPVTVNAPTSATAQVTVGVNAAPGALSVTVRTGVQTATLANAFTIFVPNAAPIVDAGPDLSITLPAGAALNGTVRDDGLPAGAGVTQTWSQVSGPGTTTFASAASATTTATFDRPGSYVLRLTADDTALTAFDEVTVAVAPPPNHVPTASAGAPVYTAKVGQPVQLDATASTDPDHDALTFSWDFGDQTTGSGPSPQHTYASAGTFTVTLTVADGNGGVATATAQVQVAPAGLGRGIITGRVFNDADGLPLAGAIITLTSVDGSSGPFDRPQTQSDTAGRYRLSSPTGTARLSILKDGFTAVQRTVAVVDSRRVNPLDARLTPLDPKSVTVTSVLGNTVTSSSADVRVTVPPGALDADVSMRATRIGGQALAGALPLGWSPAAVIEISPRDLAMRTAASLSAIAPSNLPATAVVTAVRWDDESGWVAIGAATRTSDGASLETSMSRTGQYAFVIGDAGSATPAPGQTLTAAAAASSNAAVTITPSPRILFASTSAHSLVRVLVTPSGVMTSGSPVMLDVSENYTLASGSLFLPRTPRSLPLYRFTPAAADGSSAPLEARMIASPSRAFSAFQLQRGTIDLAARLAATTTGPYGALIPATGGDFTAPTGERIAIGAGAFDTDLPVSLERIDVADLPPMFPATVTVQAAAAVDFHGATLSQPAVLTLPLPSGLPAGSQLLVLRLTDVGDSSVPEVVALASSQGSVLVTTTDPLGDGSVVFPGVRRDGWYAFVTPNQPFGFVTGIATGADALALVGAVVSSSFGLASVTAADGRYALVAAPGTTSISTRNIATGDQTTTTVQVVAGAGATQSVSVGPTPLAIASIAPSAGATGVALESAIRVLLSAPVDRASIAGSVALTAAGSAVAGSLTLSTDGQTLVLRPSSLLTSNTAYQISVGGSLRGVNGRALSAPGSSIFTTINLTPPSAPPAGTITATIPGAANTTSVSGTQGSVDPTSVVLIKNVRTGATTTLTPNADGSFSGVVAALTSDQLQMIIRSAAGVTTAVQLPAFKNPDGSVVVGAAGGHIDGPAGTFADVPPGALPDGTVVKLDVAIPADFQIDPPQGYGFVAGVKLDIGNVVAQKEIHVGVPAPADAQPGDQVLVATPVQLPLRRAWTVIDRAHFVDGRYVSQSPPFLSIALTGSYGYLKLDPTNPLTGCVSYVAVQFNFTNTAALIAGGLPGFLYPNEMFDSIRQFTIPGPCNKQLRVQVLDPNTEQEIQHATFFAPAVKDDIVTPPDILTDDTTLPTVLRVNNPTGNAVSQVQVTFSKSMNAEQVDTGFAVHDSHGNQVEGTVALDATGTILTFTPKRPFLYGEHYQILLFGIADNSGNLLDMQPITFTPFDPRSVSRLSQDGGIQDALHKCSPTGCTDGGLDVAYLGNTLFVANGLRSVDETYGDGAFHLIAVDVTDPFHPTLIGKDLTALNPRALATIENASFTAQPSGGAFNGNLLLVASGGQLKGGMLPAELAVYDVTVCTRRPVLVDNCLANTLKGFKALSTAENAEPLDGVPPDPGIPLQVAALHQKGSSPGSDVVLGYVTVAGIGLEAVDITTTFNIASLGRAPDQITRGDYFDVAVLKNKVLATTRDPASNEFRLTMFTGQLGHLIDIPPPPPPGLTALNGAARIGAAEDFVFDIDGDGHVGSAEDADNDNVKAIDELFDLAVVSSGPHSEGCPTAPPCGELYVIDLSSQTNLHVVDGDGTVHHAGPKILDIIPLPGSPFSVQLDPIARQAYVEIRGRGLAIVDLNYLLGILRGTAGPTGFVDSNGDGVDDRVLRIVPTGTGQNDIQITRIKVDSNRGVAYISGTAAGVELIQIANKANELALDFTQTVAAVRPGLDEEKRRLQGVVDGAVARLHQKLDGLWSALNGVYPSPLPVPIWVLEQGSGSCFWRDLKKCTAFQPGTSDHDLEVFVPQILVTQAQDELDDYIDGPNHSPEIDKFGDLSMFAMPKEAFERAELLNGTPLYRTGDTSGDLGMGRQTLMLLWLLEGNYVTGYEGPDLKVLFNKLKSKPANDPIFPSGQPPEPSGIPRVEGYEWARLQEFNFYKSGALLRIKGECDGNSPQDTELQDVTVVDPGDDPSDQHRDANFSDRSLLGAGCHDAIHGVAKAAIRATLARIVADSQANPIVLQVDPDQSAPDDLNAYRSNACYNVGTTSPFNLAPTNDDRKPCEAFEEYIATVALKTKFAGFTIFSPDQLQLIFKFWCLKVDCDASSAVHLITTDDDANAFIADALAFIGQVELQTAGIYQQTVRFDTRPIGPIPYLTLGPDSKPETGIAAICGKALQTAPDVVGQMLPNDTLPATIDLNTARKFLRVCNVVIVDRKVNGDPEPNLGSATLAHFQMDEKTPDGRSFKDAKKRLGVKNYVHKNLQVRALNNGARTVGVNLTLYEGDGTDPQHYQAAKSVPVTLESDATRVIASEPDPDHKGKNRPLFPVLFALKQPQIAPGTARAIAFFLDPERTVPEANKKDNQASFFYYVLPTPFAAPPTTPDAPAPPADTSPDKLALPQSLLSFTMRVRSVNGGTPYGGKDVTVAVNESVQLKYELKNLGPKPLSNVEVARQIAGEMRIVAQIGQLAPAGQTGDTAFFTEGTPYIPTQPGVITLATVARARDVNGNTVGPVSDLVYVTASEAAGAFSVKLFDRSPLSDSQHPFFRTANLDLSGHDIPLVGAVTDGDDQTGGARILISIDNLRASADATVKVVDAELPDVTDGVGWLTSEHVLQTTVTAGSSGHAELYYFPPAVFVRDAHRADDFPKVERLVKITITQPALGSTTRLVRLRRPPVFLVHGLFATRTASDFLREGAWDEFQPLVPPTGVPRSSSRPVPGFDGRFDLFSVGEPFASEHFAEGAARLRDSIKLALSGYLEGFAIGKFDVIAHSMGGLLMNKLANEDPKIAAAVRKLITLDSPFNGTALADKIVEIRNRAVIGKSELAAGGDRINPANFSGMSDQQQQDVKVDVCALAVQSLGLTPGLFIHGAVDDLQTGSDEIKALAQAGVNVPNHRVTVGASYNGGGISADILGLWAGLGVMCNLTPDESTIDATKQLQLSAKVITEMVLLLFRVRSPMGPTPSAPSGIGGELSLADATGGELSIAERSAGQLTLSGTPTQAGQLRGFQSAFFVGSAGTGASAAQADPQPVFSTTNDRAVEEASQRGQIPAGDFAVTEVFGPADHSSVKRSSSVPASACVAGNDFLDAVGDFDANSTPDVVCRVMKLLEVDPNPPPPAKKLFFRQP